MIVGGVLLAANRRVAGGLLILLSFTFLLLTQDNPMLIEHIKPKPKIPSSTEVVRESRFTLKNG